MAFEILFICTGNICRSAMAQAIARARVPAGADVGVTSAGTRGLVGWDMDAPSAAAVQELGFSPDGHAARRMEGPMIEAADLVLTATVAQRDEVIETAPLVHRRAFTMREFVLLGRLAMSTTAGVTSNDQQPLAGPVPTVDELRQRVAYVAAARGQHDRFRRAELDIGDPYGAGMPEARRCAVEVLSATDSALEILQLIPKPTQPAQHGSGSSH